MVASIIGCAAVPHAGGQAGVRSDYVHIGEGLSSAALGADAEFASRMFTIYLLYAPLTAGFIRAVTSLGARRSVAVAHPWPARSLTSRE